jgi:filamentous hemagglutinin family protein
MKGQVLRTIRFVWLCCRAVAGRRAWQTLAVLAALAVLAPSSPLCARVSIPGFYGTVTTLPTVAANAVPVLKPGGALTNATVSQPASNQILVYQSQPRAVIDWQTFNIGSNASVYFNQQGNTSWAALNRIWDANPSQIMGSLRADGRVYLINQNGILFSSGSQVNVNSLVASSLNISNDNFNNNTWRFAAENYNGRNDNIYYGAGGACAVPGPVTNAGPIQTGPGGSVFLIAPQVQNSGTILAPSGQIGLVAGTDVELSLPLDGDGNLRAYPGGESRTALLVAVNESPAGSVAENATEGLVAADTGLAGMYGRIVNQNGVVRSVTAVERGGHVELFASDTVNTGTGSLISLAVTDSAEAYNSSFATAKSDLTISGLDPASPWNPTTYPSLIAHRGTLYAPSGFVTMNAVDRVYLAAGSLIDVSGLWLDKSAEEGLYTVQLTSANLKDDYRQKGGILQGAAIKMSAYGGSAIGDVSGAFSTLSTTAAERHTTGGTVTVSLAGGLESSGTGSTGSIVMMNGATINLSGGGVRYAAGALDTTKVVSGHKIYHISAADADVRYDNILTTQTFSPPRFGVTERYEGLYYGGAAPAKKLVPAYTVGADAGTLNLLARTVVLDGTIQAQATRGLQQTQASEPTNETGYQSKAGYVMPAGGTLTVGRAAADAYGASRERRRTS